MLEAAKEKLEQEINSLQRSLETAKNELLACTNELNNLRGLFTGKRRKELEDMISASEKRLQELPGRIASLEKKLQELQK